MTNTVENRLVLVSFPRGADERGSDEDIHDQQRGYVVRILCRYTLRCV
jgi:hypothetical protein